MDTSVAATELVEDQEQQIKESSSLESITKSIEPRKKLSWSKLHTFSCARPFSITHDKGCYIKSVRTEGFLRLVSIGKFPSPNGKLSEQNVRKPVKRYGGKKVGNVGIILFILQTGCL